MTDKHSSIAPPETTTIAEQGNIYLNILDGQQPLKEDMFRGIVRARPSARDTRRAGPLGFKVGCAAKAARYKHQTKYPLSSQSH